MKYNPTKGMHEVYPMDLGSFVLYNEKGEQLPEKAVQLLFNQPMWKSYYVDGKGGFVCVDNRTGKFTRLEIKQF